MKLSLPRIIVSLLAFAAPAFAEELNLPVTGLESRVEFWKKVFTQYGDDDIIIHDRFYVNLIYDVANEDTEDSKITAVERALQEIVDNVQAPDNLSLTAKQIYAAIVENGIPISEAVAKDLRDNIHTQRGIKERFRQGVIRSGRYVSAFQDILEKEGIPAAIALLPLVESSFENRSFSKAGAAGIWQFTRGTGRLYLRINRKTDERLDPMKATRGAARLLRDNYRALGSWPLAITAYNHGRAGMLKAKNGHGDDLTTIINGYRGRLFGYASMNFYAEFVAAVQVYQQYPQYFGELVLEKPSTLATPVKTAVANASTPDKYKVRRGDTLWEIAQRFGTSIRELMEKNNLRNASIYVGQVLLVK